MDPYLHLPPELLNIIVGQLDPVSLIALSQTSCAWRELISPIHHDFVQRLLALELHPKHGGPVPLFTERDDTFSFTPPWTIEGWKDIKYACCGCMKLRGHMWFDNHAILGRRYRKPPPGSVEAVKATLTDWEPLRDSTRLKLIQKRAAQEEQARQNWRDITRRRLHYEPAHPFAKQPPIYNDDDYEALERLFAGTARQKRRCIECRYQRGDWRNRLSARLWPPPLRGIEEVPIVVSRQFPFSSLQERHFPGLPLLEPQLAPKFSPRRWRVFRDWDVSTDDDYNLYVVRCPSCGRWQESSAFRQWTLHHCKFPHSGRRPPRGQPERRFLCNHCHLATYKDPGLLAKELTDGLILTIDEDRREVFGWLIAGWRLIHTDFITLLKDVKYQAVRDEIFDGVAVAEDVDLTTFSEAHLRLYRLRFDRLRQFINDELDSKKRNMILQSWLKLWFEDYELIENMCRWLTIIQNIVLRGNPLRVLNYVMEKAPYSLS
jgi:hypothetical protein